MEHTGMFRLALSSPMYRSVLNSFTIFSQPVLQLKEEVGQQENSAIDTKTTLADIRQVLT